MVRRGGTAIPLLVTITLLVGLVAGFMVVAMPSLVALSPEQPAVQAVPYQATAVQDVTPALRHHAVLVAREQAEYGRWVLAEDVTPALRVRLALAAHEQVDRAAQDVTPALRSRGIGPVVP